MRRIKRERGKVIRTKGVGRNKEGRKDGRKRAKDARKEE